MYFYGGYFRNIIGYYNNYVDLDVMYIEMEYANGGTLSQLISQQEQSFTEVRYNWGVLVVQSGEEGQVVQTGVLSQHRMAACCYTLLLALLDPLVVTGDLSDECSVISINFLTKKPTVGLASAAIQQGPTPRYGGARPQLRHSHGYRATLTSTARIKSL